MTDTAATLTIEMDAFDFHTLSPIAMAWSPYFEERDGWEQQIQDGRFATYTGESIGRYWDIAYWFKDRSSVILARSYLRAIGEAHQVVSDEADGDWVILSDFGKDRFRE